MPFTLAISPVKTPFKSNRWLHLFIMVFTTVWITTLIGTSDMNNWILENLLVFLFLGFMIPYIIRDDNSYAQKFLSKGFLDTFSPTVTATATGNILYPLLNLFHRQIPFDFGWKLTNEFRNLFECTFSIIKNRESIISLKQRYSTGTSYFLNQLLIFIFNTPQSASLKIPPLILEVPSFLSVNTIGTSTI